MAVYAMVAGTGECIDNYDNADAAVVSLLNHWWEERGASAVVVVDADKPGKPLLATLTGGAATETPGKVYGEVLVARVYGDSVVARLFVVTYHLDAEGTYQRASLRQLGRAMA